MAGLLFLLFVTVPILELALLVWIGGRLGLAATLGLVILTGAAGAALARWQGLKVLNRLRGELNAGRMPAEAMFDGVLLLVAGAFLLTPGILTDTVGFLLLIPPFRRWLGRRVQTWAARRFRIQTITPGEPPMKEAEVCSVRDAEETGSSDESKG